MGSNQGYLLKSFLLYNFTRPVRIFFAPTQDPSVLRRRFFVRFIRIQMRLKKCFGSVILRFAQILIDEGGIYYLALTYFLKNSNNFLTDTRKYYEKRSTSYHANTKQQYSTSTVESLKLLKVVFTQRYTEKIFVYDFCVL